MDRKKLVQQIAAEIKNPEIKVLSVAKLGEAFNLIPRESELNEPVLKLMEASAKTFDDWAIIYECSDFESHLHKVSFRKMEELAVCYQEWLQLHAYAPTGSPLEKFCKEKMDAFPEEDKLPLEAQILNEMKK